MITRQQVSFTIPAGGLDINGNVIWNRTTVKPADFCGNIHCNSVFIQTGARVGRDIHDDRCRYGPYFAILADAP